MKYTIPAAFLILPFCIFAGVDTILDAHRVAFICISLILLAYLCPYKHLMPLAIYVLGWNVFSILRGENPPFMFLAAAGIVLITLDRVRIPTGVILKFLYVAAAIQATIGLMQYFGDDPIISIYSHFLNVIESNLAGQANGLLGNSNNLGAFLAIILPLCLLSLDTMPQAGLSYFILVTLMLTRCATSIVAVISAIAIAMWRRSWFYVSIIAPICVAAIITMKWSSLLVRIDMWRSALSELTTLRSWIFGLGPAAQWHGGGQIHSEYVEMIYNYGLVGLVLLLWYVGNLLMRTRDMALRTSLLTIIIIMSSNYILHMAPTAFLVLIICAMSHSTFND